MTCSEIKQILSQRKWRPLKQLGQHFLHDQNLCLWLVESACQSVTTRKNVLEIGPGLGALTEGLLEHFAHVTAIEIDRGLSLFLQERFASQSHLTLCEGDALELLPQFPCLPELVLGNLPYHISTPLLFTLLDAPHPPQQMQFLLQKEIGERLASHPHTKTYGALSVIVQAEYHVQLLRHFPPQVFYPEPQVESTVIALTRHPFSLLPLEERMAFRSFVKQGFTQRRKKLSNVLPVREERRAGALSVDDWIRLFLSQPSWRNHPKPASN